MRTFVQAVACAASLCALAACSPSLDLDFERMRQQPRADPYAASMRQPPAGVVAVDAGAEAAPDPARGREQYDVFCAVCHGVDGSGRSVMSGNLSQDRSLSLVGARPAQLSAGDLFESLSHAKGRMPEFDWAMPAADRHAVVSYVQMLQGRAARAAERGAP